MNRRLTHNEFFLAALTTLMVAGAGLCLEAATIHHQDGTVVQGRVVHETPEEIKIDTQHGTLSYSKEELTRILRDPEPAPTPVGAAAPAVSGASAPAAPVPYTAIIPAGPVDPLNPPRLPFLVQFAAGTTATAALSAPGALATPVAPQMTAVSSAPAPR